VTCPPEAAVWQTLTINGIEESVASPAAFPDDLCQRDGNGRVHVPGLAPELARCYDAAVLPSEVGARWAAPGRPIDLSAYHHFPGGASPDGTLR